MTLIAQNMTRAQDFFMLHIPHISISQEVLLKILGAPMSTRRTRVRYATLFILLLWAGFSQITSSAFFSYELRNQIRSPERTLLLALSCFVSLSCVLVGFAIGFRRPSATCAWLAMALLVSFGHFAGSGGTLVTSGWAARLAFISDRMLGNVWPPCIVLLVLQCPVPLGAAERYLWFKWFVICPGLAVIAARAFLPTAISGMVQFAESIRKISIAVYALYILLLFLLAGAKWLTTKNQILRHELTRLALGCFLGLSAFITIVFTDVKILRHTPVWAMLLCWTTTLAIPGSVASLFVSPQHRPASNGPQN